MAISASLSREALVAAVERRLRARSYRIVDVEPLAAALGVPVDAVEAVVIDREHRAAEAERLRFRKRVARADAIFAHALARGRR